MKILSKIPFYYRKCGKIFFSIKITWEDFGVLSLECRFQESHSMKTLKFCHLFPFLVLEECQCIPSGYNLCILYLYGRQMKQILRIQTSSLKIIFELEIRCYVFQLLKSIFVRIHIFTPVCKNVHICVCMHVCMFIHVCPNVCKNQRFPINFCLIFLGFFLRGCGDGQRSFYFSTKYSFFKYKDQNYFTFLLNKEAS